MDKIVTNAIVTLFDLSKRFKSSEARYKAKKEELVKILNDYFDDNKGDTLEVQDNSLEKNIIVCKKVQPQRIIFDIDAIEKKFSKKDCATFIDKTYSIVDYKGLVDMLKSHGIKPKDFKKFIEVKKTINENNLNQLYEIGVLSLDDLKGLYDIKKSKAYYKVSKKK